MLLNNKHYYNLPPQERKNLWKHYKKVYPNMGYTDMVKHFNGEVENYQMGGETKNSFDKKNEDYVYNQWRKSLPKNLRNESKDYNLRGAWEAGLQPEYVVEDMSFHLKSRNPNTGEILKSPGHSTYNMAIEGDIKAGYAPRIDVKTGKLYTINPNDPATAGPFKNYQFGGRTDYFNSDVKKFVDGGTVTFSTDGEKHVVYKKESPTGMGKGKEGHIMVNHPTKDKGKWDTIDLTEKANAKTVAQGVAATKKWHRENPMEKYAIGGKTDKYVAERDATSTVKTPAIATNPNAFKQKVNKEDNFGKYAVDAAGLFFYPASVVGSAIDFYQGDNVGGVAGLIPFGKGFKALKNIKMAGRGKTINKLNRGVDNLLMTHLGTQIYDAKSDLIDPLIKDKKAKQ